MSDMIRVRDIQLSCIIGINPWERQNKQPVILNLAMACDLSKAGRSDRIEDTLDYRKLNDRIIREIETSEYSLIERLAEHVADICLENPIVREVSVTVDKPGALTGARSVAVEISRSRPDA